VEDITHVSRDRSKLRNVSNETSSRAEDPIKASNQPKWKANKYRGTVVYSTGDKSMNQRHSSSMRKGTSHNTDLAKLIIATSSDQVNVLRKAKLLV
jgi:phage gpG-like protein